MEEAEPHHLSFLASPAYAKAAESSRAGLIILPKILPLNNQHGAALLRVEHPVDKYAATLGGAVRVDAPARSLRFRDERGSRVFIHPASICFSAGRFDSGWLVATGIVHVGGKASTRVVSAAPAYGVLLFGGRLDVRHGDGELVMDGWARFAAPARTGVLIRELRAAVDGLLAAKLADPGVSLVGAPAVGAMHRLLETDGF